MHQPITVTAATLREIAASEEDDAITIAERNDTLGRPYFTPVQRRPVNPGFMAARVATRFGSIVGPRFSARALCEAAIAFDAEVKAALAR